MTTLFISDLHLDPSRPAMQNLFINFATTTAKEAQALYILGDFFEYWVGDDDPAAHFQPIIDALAALSASGVALYFQHGNRDFLIGREFAARCGGMTLLSDYHVLDLYGRKTLLAHGDTLCTDDIPYQQLRQQLRNSQWQREFLSLPLAARHAQAKALREKSRQAQEDKAEVIMDVNQQTVETVMRHYHCDWLIHGHTHRQGEHEFTLDGKTVKRSVLGDWFESGNALVVNENNSEMLKLT